MISLADFDLIIINSSGGKDSQCMLDVMSKAYKEQRLTAPMYVLHADLGRMEWPGTKELAAKQAAHYGLPFLVAFRADAAGAPDSLLEHVRRRGKWPDSGNRYCTSDLKRDPCAKVIRKLSSGLAEPRSPRRQMVLNCFGFRAQESPARAKREALSANKRLSCVKRMVHDFLPIHDLTEEEVWATIRESKVPHHPAYDLGMSRLSCSFCIFAPQAALMIAGRARPDLLQEYVNLEREIGHDFQHRKPIRKIQEAIQRVEGGES